MNEAYKWYVEWMYVKISKTRGDTNALNTKTVQPVIDNFEAFDIFEAYSDFNDLIIAHTVPERGLRLLSDDGDFKNSLGIYNKNLLYMSKKIKKLPIK